MIGALKMAKDNDTSKKLQDVLDDLVARHSKETGLSRNQIAKEIGIAPSALSAYCSAEKEAGIDSLRKIADYFKVPTDYLLGRTKCPSPDIDEQRIFEMIELSPESIQRLNGFMRSGSGRGINLINYLIERGGLIRLCHTVYVSAHNIWSSEKRLETMGISDERVEAGSPDEYQIKSLKEDIEFQRWTLSKEAEKVIQDVIENGIYPILGSKYGNRRFDNPVEAWAALGDFTKDAIKEVAANAETQE